jgi:hypothetical protein
MYVWAVTGLGELSSCPVDLTSGPTGQALFDRIRVAIDCELRLPSASSTHPGLFLRRQRLKALFGAVPPGLTSTLQRELELAQTAFARLFWHRLHPATAREPLRLLSRAFFTEYELRFNPAPDTFSVDTNPNPSMNATTKALRKQDVNGLIGDKRSSPGVLWKRLLARVDAALETPRVVPSSLALPGPADLAAIARLSDAQLALFSRVLSGRARRNRLRSVSIVLRAIRRRRAARPVAARPSRLPRAKWWQLLPVCRVRDSMRRREDRGHGLGPGAEDVREDAGDLHARLS